MPSELDTAAPSQPTPSTAQTGAAAEWHPLSFTSRDGTKIAGRHYRLAATAKGQRRPVLCLAGLTRNSRDFDVLAAALNSGPDAREVYTLDMRGRGASDWDRDWRNYSILVEAGDVQDFMTIQGLWDVALVGTSRGGLIAMVLGAMQPTRLGAVVLNDIGPVIERESLARIASYLGARKTPGDWETAGRACQKLGAASFPDLVHDDWVRLARQWFNEQDGRPAPGYDPALAKTFADVKDGIPPLWPQFESLKRIACLTIRGALSDLLTDETVREMARRHPRFSSHTVPRQGHAPLLEDDETIGVIKDFLARSDFS